MKKLCLLLGLGVALATSACSSTQEVTKSEANFRLFVDVVPKEAIIIVDDAVVGNGEKTTEIPLKIQAGTRRIAIVSPGYYPFKTTLEYIQPGETYTLKTRLITEEF